MIRRPPRSTLDRSSAASDVYKRQKWWDTKSIIPNNVNYRGDDYEAFKIEKSEKLLDACLLYTSPSPRDRTRSRMPSSA